MSELPELSLEQSIKAAELETRAQMLSCELRRIGDLRREAQTHIKQAEGVLEATRQKLKEEPVAIQAALEKCRDDFAEAEVMGEYAVRSNLAGWIVAQQEWPRRATKLETILKAEQTRLEEAEAEEAAIVKKAEGLERRLESVKRSAEKITAP